ncbi:hypothetical protein BASA81_016243 [Batrachochytrium salamandrivorans]|nr:hypothetical protein BASA81_016243 [Batrachochytrium salamandrivorans]
MENAHKMSFECLGDSQGKFTCLFNGTMLPCNQDVDCPGNGNLCYHNASWSAVDNQCACYVEYGLQGIECNQTGNPALFVVLCLLLLSSLAVLGLGLDNARKHSGFTLGNTHHVTNLLLLISAILGILMSLTYMARLGGTLPFQILENGSKLPPNWVLGNVLFALWFTFVGFSTLHVSVTWLAIAQRVEGTSKRLVKYYTMALYAYLVVFLVTVVVLLLTGAEENMVGYISLPVLLYFCIVYMIAFYRLNKFLKRSKQLNAQDEGIHKISTEVARTTLRVSLMSIAIILFVVLNVLLKDEGMDTPNFPAAQFAGLIGYLFGSLITLVVAIYTWRFSGDSKLTSTLNNTNSKLVLSSSKPGPGAAVEDSPPE